MHTNVKRSIPN